MRLALVWCAMLVCALGAQITVAQDVVVTLSDKGTEVPRKGTILRWMGDTLTIDVGGRERQLRNKNIVRIETSWSAAYQQAEASFEAREFRKALESYQAALQSEQRDWARVIILSRMVQCCSVLENHAIAGTCFAQMVRLDPSTRFIHLIPLSWLRSFSDASIKEKAVGWMRSNDAATLLMGASWLLGSDARDQAVSTLEELTQGVDANVAHLAKLQLWRAKVVTAKQPELRRLQLQIDNMPKQIQAPAMFILADIQSRLEMRDEALLTTMRIPILHSDNLKLSAAALQNAAEMMRDTGQIKEAARLYRELERDFGDTRFSREASAQLQQLQNNQ